MLLPTPPSSSSKQAELSKDISTLCIAYYFIVVIVFFLFKTDSLGNVIQAAGMLLYIKNIMTAWLRSTKGRSGTLSTVQSRSTPPPSVRPASTNSS